MRIPMTLSFYIGRNFLASIAIAMGVVLSVAGLIDFIEIARRTANKPNVPFHVVVEMALLKLPYMAESILPYGILVGTMMTLTKMTRSQELVIARASGVSVWQFLAPLIIVAAAISIFVIVLFNPVAASLISRYEKLENQHISGKTSMLSISSSGLWLRQLNSAEQNANPSSPKIYDQPMREYILHASKVEETDMSLDDVTIFVYGDNHQFIGRMDAEKAKLENGRWDISNNVISSPNKPQQKSEHYQLPTDLNISQIQDSFADPRTLSFWQLTGFINTLEKAGFSALRHKVHWHAILSSPILLCGMVLIAAVFSLRLHRSGKISLMIVSGVAAGFTVNFLINLFHAFGYSGTLPLALASWAPPAIFFMAGAALLLHLEDG